MDQQLPPWLLAGIRTAVQAAIGWTVAWLATRNITISAEVLEAAAFAIVTGLVTALLRLAEKKFPWISRILSIGLTSTKPVYVEPAAVEGTQAA